MLIKNITPIQEDKTIKDCLDFHQLRTLKQVINFINNLNKVHDCSPNVKICYRINNELKHIRISRLSRRINQYLEFEQERAQEYNQDILSSSML